MLKYFFFLIFLVDPKVEQINNPSNVYSSTDHKFILDHLEALNARHFNRIINCSSFLWYKVREITNEMIQDICYPRKINKKKMISVSKMVANKHYEIGDLDCSDESLSEEEQLDTQLSSQDLPESAEIEVRLQHNFKAKNFQFPIITYQIQCAFQIFYTLAHFTTAYNPQTVHGARLAFLGANG
jgi:hypothetical protein